MQQESSTFLKGFPERLRWLRERLRLTQGELGRTLGVSEGTMQNWEVGRSEPRNNLVWENLAKAVGCSVPFLHHGMPKTKEDFALFKLHTQASELQSSSGLGHILQENSASFDAPTFRPATRADCEAHVKTYLDKAQNSANGIPFAFVTIKRALRLDDLPESDEAQALKDFEQARSPAGIIAAGHPQDTPGQGLPATPRRKKFRS